MFTQLVLLTAVGVAIAGSIKDVEHIVLFMQENRAFNHYFGEDHSFHFE